MGKEGNFFAGGEPKWKDPQTLPYVGGGKGGVARRKFYKKSEEKRVARHRPLPEKKGCRARKRFPKGVDGENGVPK